MEEGLTEDEEKEEEGKELQQECGADDSQDAIGDGDDDEGRK